MDRSTRAPQAISLLAVIIGAWLAAGTRTVSGGQAQQAATEVSLTGCLVEEAEYAADHGLARTPNGDRTITQLVFIPDEQSRAAGGGTSGVTIAEPPAYALTGPNEQRLAINVHQQVSLQGHVERDVLRAVSSPPDSSSAGQLTPDGAAGITADGSPAHEPTDAVGGRRQDVRAVRTNGRSASTDELDRIEVTSARVIGGTCSIPRDRVATATSPVPDITRVARPPAPSASQPDTTVAGCLALRDGADATPVLTLLAVPPDARPIFARSAVPGSLPSGAGSGTIGTSGTSASAPPSEPLVYRLTGSPKELAAYVGQRVQVTGAEDPGEIEGAVRGTAAGTPSRTEPPAAETAHPSAGQRTLRVTGFRPLGGVCR